LGDFLPLGQVIALEVFSKITEVAHILLLLFYKVKVVYISFLTKNGLGYILGNFFTNSSGHPEHELDPICSDNTRREFSTIY
jgi:hypothetical protein